MIDLRVAIAAKHQAAITAELVRIDDAAIPDGLYRQTNQDMDCLIGYNPELDFAISLQNAKYKHFTGSATSPVTLAVTTKIAFNQLDFASHESMGINDVS